MAEQASTLESFICDHHIYKHIWHPLVREILTLERKEGNNHDKFPVNLLKHATFIAMLVFVGVLALPQARRDHHLWSYRYQYRDMRPGGLYYTSDMGPWVPQNSSDMGTFRWFGASLYSLSTRQQCASQTSSIRFWKYLHKILCFHMPMCYLFFSPCACSVYMSACAGFVL